ncbi:MAG TPA: ABC transporter substrate-binding protein, partial [Thermoanaerobaculaceae bacterium]|nr:ABC transporter substrate-binding protein [Thermoanaerobaculaceae bacterium]
MSNKPLLTALTVACIVLGGCGGGGSPVGTPAGETMVVAIPADVETFNDYQSAGEAMENAIIDLLFPTLFEEQPDFAEHPPSFAPRLAESWEFSPSHLALTVKLREGATWSDGFRVTADDVRFTFQAQTSEAAGSTYVEQKAAIARVEVVDASTVRFHFKRVYPYQLMDANDGHIVPAHAWGKVPF